MENSLIKNILKKFGLLIFFAIITVCFAVIVFQTAKEQINQRLKTNIIKISSKVENRFNNKLNLIKTASDILSIDGTYQNEDETKQLLNYYCNYFDDVLITSKNGIGYTSNGLSCNLSSIDNFDKIVGSNEETIFEPNNYLTADSIFFTSPIIENEEVVRIVIGTISKSELTSDIFQDVDTKISAFFLIDSSNSIVVNSSEEILNGENICNYLTNKTKIDFNESDTLMNNATNGELVSFGAKNEFFLANSAITNGWNIICLSNINDIISDGLDSIITFIIIACGIFVFISAVYIISIISDSKHNKIVEIIAYHDSITGLFNMKKLELLANKKIRRFKNKYVVVSVDIQKFAIINEYYGRDFGNHILKTLAKIIQESIPSKALFARGISDSFVIFMTYYSNEEVCKLSEDIQNKINIVTDGEKTVNILLHVGAYIIENKETTLLEAYDKSALARKQTKNPDENNFRFYDSIIDEKIKTERHIESIASDALINEEFMEYYQPKVDLRNKKTIGAEALVRWKHDGEIIYPNDFIPIFEKNGFVVNLDFYILEKVCQDMVFWMKKGIKLVTISINFSRLHLSDPNLVEKIVEVVDNYEIPHKYIEIEITESVWIDNYRGLIELTAKLKKAKFSVSMDDFGSGYSSLNALKDIDVDVIKLDKDFFQKGRASKKSKVILTNIINMANELGLKIICEGVETESQANFLIENKCYNIQGYYFSKPIPKDEFENKFL